MPGLVALFQHLDSSSNFDSLYLRQRSALPRELHLPLIMLCEFCTFFHCSYIGYAGSGRVADLVPTGEGRVAELIGNMCGG